MSEAEENGEADFPSEKEIKEAFPKLDSSKVSELFNILKNATSPDAHDDDPDDAMEKANAILDGHGVEGIKAEDGYQVDRFWRDTILIYVNQGDTYETTICYDTEEGAFFVGSWGDFVEEWEKGGEEDEDEEEGEDEEEEEESEDEEDEEEDDDDETSTLDEEVKEN